MEMLETGEHDFSSDLQFSYAKYRDSKVFGLMAVPVFGRACLCIGLISLSTRIVRFARLAILKVACSLIPTPDPNFRLYCTAPNAR